MVKKLLLISFLCIYLFTIVGCQDQGVEPINIDELNEQMINANQTFSFEIFKALQKEDKGKDIFISPLSIATALSMTLKGAVDETEPEMMNTLNVSHISEDVIDIYNQNLLQVLNDYQGDIDLSIKNS